jgi:hypothetical protein
MGSGAADGGGRTGPPLVHSVCRHAPTRRRNHVPARFRVTRTSMSDSSSLIVSSSKPWSLALAVSSGTSRCMISYMISCRCQTGQATPERVSFKMVKINGLRVASATEILIWFSWKFWNHGWMVWFGTLLDQVVSSFALLLCFQYSNLMQIDLLTFQQGFWSTYSMD